MDAPTTTPRRPTFSIFSHQDQLNDRATASYPAMSNRRHVIEGFIFHLMCEAAGAGATETAEAIVRFGDRVIYSFHMTVKTVAGETAPPVVIGGIHVEGEINESVTIEYLGPIATAGVHQSVFLSGFTEYSKGESFV